MATALETALVTTMCEELAVSDTDRTWLAAGRHDACPSVSADERQGMASADDGRARSAAGWASADLLRFRHELTSVLDIAIWRFGFEAELEEALDDAFLRESLRETPVLAESRNGEHGLIYAA